MHAGQKRIFALWSVLVVVFVLFSLLPSMYELSRYKDLQPNRQFELVHNFPTDYNFYLSRIREGLEGRLTSVERYTAEPHQGSLIHEMYILMGRVGRMVRVPLHREADVYHVSRIVLSLTLLSVIVWYCHQQFGASPYIAFFLIMTASSWSKLVFVDGVPRFGGYMAWWSVMDSLQRITFIPHLLAGQALIIAILLLLTQKDVIKKTGNLVFIGLLACALGMIFPPGLLFVYVVLGVYGLLQGREITKVIVPYIFVFLISMPSLVYLGLMTQVYPWKRLVEVDIIRPLPFDYFEYMRALGPMFVFGLAGLGVSIWKREKRMMLSVSWILAWIGLLIGFKFVPQQSPLRFSEMIPHVPLGLLSAYLFYQSVTWIDGMVGRKKTRVFFLTLKSFLLVLPILLIGLGLIHMYSSWLWQRDFVDHKIRATTPLVPTGSYVMYPLKDFIAAISYIKDATKPDTIVLSESTAGNYIPVYSSNRVYLGHDNTVSYEEKKVIASEFFAGRMNTKEASNFLAKNAIRMIFYGPQEKEEAGIGDLSTVYPMVKQVYKNSYVTIYSVL